MPIVSLTKPLVWRQMVEATRIRYCTPSADPNQSRWPVRGLWRQFEDVIGSDLLHSCATVLPSDVIHANRTAKMRERDAQLSGLFLTRAAFSDVSADDFNEFMEKHVGDWLMSILFQQKIGSRRRKQSIG